MESDILGTYPTEKLFSTEKGEEFTDKEKKNFEQPTQKQIDDALSFKLQYLDKLWSDYLKNNK